MSRGCPPGPADGESALRYAVLAPDFVLATVTCKEM